MKKITILMLVFATFAFADIDSEQNPIGNPPSSTSDTREAEVPDFGAVDDLGNPPDAEPGENPSTPQYESGNEGNQSATGSTEEQEPVSCLGGGGIVSFLPMIAIIAIFYFLMIRPQQKQAKRMKAMREAMKISDKVVTAGGIHGVITNIKGDVATVRIADGVKIDVDKTSLSVEDETTGSSCCSTCK